MTDKTKHYSAQSSKWVEFARDVYNYSDFEAFNKVNVL